MPLNLTGDPTADAVLDEHPFALLAGMMLDQQFPMERAFAGPAKVLERFGSLDPAAIAAADPDEFAALCSTPPAPTRSRARSAPWPTSWTAPRSNGSGRSRRSRRPRRVVGEHAGFVLETPESVPQ